MVTSVCLLLIDAFGIYLKSVYPETKTNTGSLLDYVGMTFNFEEKGRVRVTMDDCVEDILSGCGVDTTRVTPAVATLFDVRDAPKATKEEAKWLHTNVAKVLSLPCEASEAGMFDNRGFPHYSGEFLRPR